MPELHDERSGIRVCPAVIHSRTIHFERVFRLAQGDAREVVVLAAQ
jgi:hypothetical protein